MCGGRQVPFQVGWQTDSENLTLEQRLGGESKGGDYLREEYARQGKE